MQYAVVQYTLPLEPLLTILSLFFSLSRQSCWVVTDRTWWQEVITGLWRCGKRATSNSFTSIQAVTQASVPWTSHMTRGKTDRVLLWQTEEDADSVTICNGSKAVQGCVCLRTTDAGETGSSPWGRAEYTEWSVMGQSFYPVLSWCPSATEMCNDWCKKKSILYPICIVKSTDVTFCVLCPQDPDHWHGVRQHRGVQHRLQPLALRTPEQVLRWTAWGRGRWGEESETRGRGGDAFCRVSATQGNYRYRAEGKASTGP